MSAKTTVYRAHATKQFATETSVMYSGKYRANIYVIHTYLHTSILIGQWTRPAIKLTSTNDPLSRATFNEIVLVEHKVAPIMYAHKCSLLSDNVQGGFRRCKDINYSIRIWESNQKHSYVNFLIV